MRPRAHDASPLFSLSRARARALAPHALATRLGSAAAALAFAALAAGCLPAQSPASPSVASAPQASGTPGVGEGTVASADGVPIHYASAGLTSDSAVVFVHGWSCSGRTWDSEVRALSPHYRVVTLDLAGHGQSGKGRAAYTIGAFAEDVRAVVAALGLRRVVLVGHSMGGPVILEAAKRMPERVVGLVPIDTLHDVEHVGAKGEEDALFARLRQDFRGTTAGLVHQLFLPSSDPAVVARVVAEMTSADPAVAIPSLQALFAYPEASGLDGIKVPIRAINASVRATHVEVNRRHAPQYDAIVMTGVGHWPMLERPAEFDARLAEVLGGMPL